MKSISIILFTFFFLNSFSQAYILKPTNKIYSQRGWDSIWNASSPSFVRVLNDDFERRTKTVELKPANKTEFIKNYHSNRDYCGREKRMPIKKIFKTKPFDSIASIQLVSFKGEEFLYKPDEEEEGVIMHKEYEVPLLDGKVDMTKMFEVKTLDAELMNATADILINFCEEPTGIALCYEPRNAILFLNKKGTIVGYIEICFACWRYKIRPIEFNIPTIYSEKLEVLQNLFIVTGIKHGTNPFH